MGISIIKTCEICNKEFRVWPYRAETARFCSMSCRATGINKAREYSEEHISKLHQGRDKFVYTKEVREKMSQIKKEQYKIGLKPWNTGLSVSSNNALSKWRANGGGVGEKAHNWKGGISKIYQKLRSSPEYQRWRKLILERDDYRCLDCGERGGKLQVDHIYSFKDYPRLRLDTNNGQTLCVPCHKIKTWGWAY